jgi:hypothetical protein
VRALADVSAEVDGPEQRAVEFIALEDGRVGRAVLRMVAAATDHVDDEVVVAVAVEVAGGAVVGGVAPGGL